MKQQECWALVAVLAQAVADLGVRDNTPKDVNIISQGDNAIRHRLAAVAEMSYLLTLWAEIALDDARRRVWWLLCDCYGHRPWPGDFANEILAKAGFPDPAAKVGGDGGGIKSDEEFAAAIRGFRSPVQSGPRHGHICYPAKAISVITEAVKNGFGDDKDAEVLIAGAARLCPDQREAISCAGRMIRARQDHN